ADFTIGQSRRRKPCDLEFLSRQTVTGVRRTRADRLTCCAELLARALAPRCCTKQVEQLDASAKGFARIGVPTLTPQTAPVREQGPSIHARVLRQIIRECRGEERRRVSISGQERPRARQSEAEKWWLA